MTSIIALSLLPTISLADLTKEDLNHFRYKTENNVIECQFDEHGQNYNVGLSFFVKTEDKEKLLIRTVTTNGDCPFMSMKGDKSSFNIIGMEDNKFYYNFKVEYQGTTVNFEGNMIKDNEPVTLIKEKDGIEFIISLSITPLKE